VFCVERWRGIHEQFSVVLAISMRGRDGRGNRPKAKKLEGAQSHSVGEIFHTFVFFLYDSLSLSLSHTHTHTHTSYSLRKPEFHQFFGEKKNPSIEFEVQKG
jgi:hypothetical protein